MLYLIDSNIIIYHLNGETIATTYNLKLVTRNTKDFKSIKLDVYNPFDKSI